MHIVAKHRYSHRDPRPYLQFLQDCIAEADRRHTPAEIAAAAALLLHPIRPVQPELVLPSREGRSPA